MAMAVAVLVGSLQSLVQQVWALPIIHAAEQVEERNHGHAHKAQAHGAHGQADRAEWSPATGWERQLWTWVANVNLSFALSLLVLCALGYWVKRKGPVSSGARFAVITASAGFFCTYAWPTLGLPAEIPGMESAALPGRQVWWFLAVASALVALWLVAFTSWRMRWGLAALLLALPLAAGAPYPADPFAGLDDVSSSTLRQLSQKFAWASAVTMLVQWLALGVACSFAFNRWLLPLFPGEWFPRDS